ncbi:MAG TPA: endonuclease domain-containing protein [Patescibacteria group bacterium]|nr:endonuclease domain-containing protein [Patescibacteria group bacterium]
MTEIFNRQSQRELRKILRNRPTRAENKLWYFLRNKNLGAKFRRQYGIDRYIADFYSPERQLVVEVDGDSHGTIKVKKNDDIRQKYFEALGLLVIRFTNSEVLGNMEGVLRVIQETIDQRRPPLAPPL